MGKVLLMILMLVFLFTVDAFAFVDKGYFSGKMPVSGEFSTEDIPDEDENEVEPDVTVGFNPENFEYYVYDIVEVDGETREIPIWSFKDGNSLVDKFGAWHRGQHFLKEVIPSIEEESGNYVMKLECNTPKVGGFWIRFDVPDELITSDFGLLSGEVGASVRIKRTPNFEGKIFLEIKYEPYSNCADIYKLQEIDITDQIKGVDVNEWVTVELSKEIDKTMLNNTGVFVHKPKFTVAVNVKAEDEDNPGVGELYVDALSIDYNLEFQDKNREEYLEEYRRVYIKQMREDERKEIEQATGLRKLYLQFKYRVRTWAIELDHWFKENF